MDVIAAILRKTLLEAMRSRVALVIIGLFLIATPVLLFKPGADPTIETPSARIVHIEADGTQTGEVKVLLTYSFAVAAVLLMGLTVYLGCSTLVTEMQRRQIQLLASKPVRPWQILVGKWLGIVVLNAWLLLIMGALTICYVYFFARLDPARPGGYMAVRKEILTSRRSVKPETPSPERLYSQMKRRLRENGVDVDRRVDRELRYLAEQRVERQSIRVPPLGVHVFELEGIPDVRRKGAGAVTIRYKLYAMTEGRRRIRAHWAIGRPDRSFVVERTTLSPAGEAREFQVPPQVVGEDGRMMIQFRNLAVPPETGPAVQPGPGVPVSFSGEEGLEVLAPTPSVLGGFLQSLTEWERLDNFAATLPFLMNFLRGLLLLLVRLAFLAAAAVAVTTFVNFHVGLLVLLPVLFVGFAHSMLVGEVADAPKPMRDDEIFVAGEVTQRVANVAYKRLLEPAVHGVVRGTTAALPDFEQTNPSPDLTVGREIGWIRIGLQALWDLVLRGGGVILIGAVVLRHRELAKP